MKKKIRPFIYALILTTLALILTYSCKKKDDNTTTGPVPTINTIPVDSIKGTTARCGGIIATDNGSTITSRGVCWSTGIDPTISNSTTIDGAGAGTYVSHMTGLAPLTTYYVRAYATNANGTGYGPSYSFTTLAIAVGDYYQGGKIAYIFVSGDPGYVAGQIHGLIAATSDQSTGLQWYNGSNVTTGATSQSIGSGNANTNTIVSVQGSGSYAAKLCADLSLGGYSDWYLPSFNELYKLYINRSYIGGFESTTYWTSSEYDLTQARFVDFMGGPSMYTNKSAACNVRAVRTF